MKQIFITYVSFFFCFTSFCQRNDSITSKKNIIEHKAKALSVKDYLTTPKTKKRVIKKVSNLESNNASQNKKIVDVPKINAMSLRDYLYNEDKSVKKAITKHNLKNKNHKQHIISLPKIKALTLKEYLSSPKVEKLILRKTKLNLRQTSTPKNDSSKVLTKKKPYSTKKK